MNEKIVILPDIHGRTFWKKVFKRYPKEEYPDLKIVFLGDYVDPYPHEDITKEEALNNFTEIVDAAKNDDRVVLLIGNHDWHYLHTIDYCRIDQLRFDKVRNLILDNISLFKMGYADEVNGKKYLFTHAGVLRGWFNKVKRMAEMELEMYAEKGTLEDNKEHTEFLEYLADFNPDTDDICEYVNKMLNPTDGFYSIPMSQISGERGGRYVYGSPIWADVHEHFYGKDIEGIFQVFGHTITYPDGQYSYYIPEGGNYAMLDASMPFILYGNGEIKPFEIENVI